MHTEIKTADVEPIRHTYAYVAKRFGDKPASRYQEATYDIQEESNFHYRPLWQPEKELFDASRTEVVMADWYALKDPRQMYYQTYTTTRARQQEIVEANFAFVEKKGLLATVSDDVRSLALAALLPLRHYEWGANMNNTQITAFAYGAALTNATMFATMDRLGTAQYLTRIGLLFDGNQGSSLTAAKEQWLNGQAWQPLRAAVEKMFVTEDWFELFVAHNLVFDGLLYPLVYGRFERRLMALGGAPISMLTSFESDWFAETSPWVDSVLKTVAAESDANREKLAAWIGGWRAQAIESLRPLATLMLGSDDADALDGVVGEFDARIKKIGLTFEGVSA